MGIFFDLTKDKFFYTTSDGEILEIDAAVERIFTDDYENNMKLLDLYEEFMIKFDLHEKFLKYCEEKNNV